MFERPFQSFGELRGVFEFFVRVFSGVFGTCLRSGTGGGMAIEGNQRHTEHKTLGSLLAPHRVYSLMTRRNYLSLRTHPPILVSSLSKRVTLAGFSRLPLVVNLGTALVNLGTAY